MSGKVFHGYVDYTIEPPGLPFYVGKGDESRVRDPWRNRKQIAIARKHGLRRVVEYSSRDERAVLEWEIATIARLDTFRTRLGCNFTRGGEGGCGAVHAPEAKERHREAGRRIQAAIPLHVKQARARATLVKHQAEMSAEERSAIAQRSRKSLSHEQWSAIARKREASKSPEQRKAQAAKMRAARTEDGIRLAARKALASYTTERRSRAMTPEQRRQAALKGHRHRAVSRSTPCVDEESET